MNESRPSSFRDRVAAYAEKYRPLQPRELLEALDEQARAGAAAEPPADRNPGDGPSNGPSNWPERADEIGWLWAAADDEDLLRRVFQDFGERLDELMWRIFVVLEDDLLHSGRRRDLLQRISVVGEFLVEQVHAGEADLGRCTP